MSEHAKLSPSSADRWMACPGSIRESAGMPNKSSKYADEGTRAHTLAEKILRGESETLHVDGAESFAHIKTYTDHVASLPGVRSVEVRVTLTDDVYGTADAIVWDANESVLYVRDLKFGAGIPVEVSDNTQLRIYGLAALLTMRVNAKFVDIGIVQPRCFHPAGPVRTVRFLSVDLLDFWADVLAAVAATKQPTAALVPGEHCRFCPAAALCVALKTSVQTAAKAVFAPAQTYSSAELAKALDWLPVVEGWVKNVREFAYAEAEAGRAPPDYKLVEKKAIRKWIEDPDLMEKLRTKLGVSNQALLEHPKLRGVVDIEKLAKGTNAKQRAACIEEFVTKISSGHSLVRSDDARPAIAVDAKSVFALPNHSN